MKFKDWFVATRPWSFAASALPAVVAFLYTAHTHSFATIRITDGLLAILGAILFHAAGNLVSDYFDFKHEVDREGTIGSPNLTSGLFTPKQILRYGQACLAAGILLGLLLAYRVGWPLLWVGAFGIVSAGFYHVFKFRALGDLLIFLVFGPAIMLGTGFCLLGYFDFTLVYVSVPISLITVNILHANNTRDIVSDGQANIKTFAMLLGFKASIVQYRLLTIAAYLSVLLMAVFGILPWISLITYLTIPIALRNSKVMSQVKDGDVSTINELDKGTAQLQVAFSGLLSIALLVSIIVC